MYEYEIYPYDGYYRWRVHKGDLSPVTSYEFYFTRRGARRGAERYIDGLINPKPKPGPRVDRYSYPPRKQVKQ